MPITPASPEAVNRVAAALRSARTARGWTQAELGSRLGGVPASTIANWESGLHSPKRHAHQIEKILGVSILQDLGISRSEAPSASLRRLGDAIRQARRRAGLTQEQAAAAAGISASTLSNWERGLHEPAPTLVAQLDRVLQTDLLALVDPAADDPSSVEDLRSRVRDLTDEELDGLFSDLAAEKLRRAAER